MPQDGDNLKLTRVLIDALFRTRAIVPLDEAAALYDVLPDVAVALITAIPRNTNQEVLTLMTLLRKTERDQNRPRWLALASILRSSVDFKRYLAEQVRFDYSIDVVDDADIRPIQVFQGAPFGVIGGVIGAIPSDEWPDAPSYRLADVPGGGSEVLIASSFAGDVFLVRSDWPYGPRVPPSAGWKEHPKDVLRMLYTLAHCQICASGPQTREYPNILGGRMEIIWRSAPQVKRLLDQTVDEYVEECRALLSALGDGDWSADQVRSKVAITVSDQRRNKTEPLPSASGSVSSVLR